MDSETAAILRQFASVLRDVSKRAFYACNLAESALMASNGNVIPQDTARGERLEREILERLDEITRKLDESH